MFKGIRYSTFIYRQLKAFYNKIIQKTNSLYSSKLILISFLYTIPLLYLHASASTEEYSVILESDEYFYNIALEKAIIKKTHNNGIQAKVEHNPNYEKSIVKNIIQKDIEEKIPIIILQIDDQEDLDSINNIIIDKGILEHSIVNYTLIASPFFSSLIFINTLPSMEQKPLVPWGFIGYDIKHLVETQLNYIRTNHKNNNTDNRSDPLHILVIALQHDSIFQHRWLETLEKLKQDNEIIHIEYIENITVHSIASVLEASDTISLYKNTEPLHLMSLYDDATITTRLTLNTLQNKNMQESVSIGFGGSPEAQRAIQQGLLSMSIVPNYTEYSTKIFLLASRLQSIKRNLFTNHYLIDEEQKSTVEEFISFSLME